MKTKEREILEAVHKMGIESLDPENFEQLDSILNILCETRHIPALKGME